MHLFSLCVLKELRGILIAFQSQKKRDKNGVTAILEQNQLLPHQVYFFPVLFYKDYESSEITLSEFSDKSARLKFGKDS